MLDFARVAEAIGATTSTLEKTRLLAEYLSRLDTGDLRRAAVWMTGALRFPRIVRLREDKPTSEIDTLSRVRDLHERYFARGTPLAEVAEPS